MPSSSSLTNIHLIKKFELGGKMNEEEAKMNRALLEEISAEKKRSQQKKGRI